MKKALLILALLLIPLLPLQLAEGANPPFKFKVGYSAEKMFDATTGVPVFIAGETIWIYPGEPIIVSISRPDGRPAAAVPLGEHPYPLYTFKDTDILGTWLLRIESRAGQFTFPVEFVQQSIKPDGHEAKFSLEEDSLGIKGIISFSPPEIPSSTEVILVRKSRNESLVNIATNVTIGGSQVVLQITKGEGAVTTLRVSPYAPIGGVDYEADVANGPVFTTWADIIMEIPLTKRTGRSLIVTYVDDAIARTPKVATQLPGQPENTLALRISPRGTAEDSATVPTKYGRATLNVYMQQGATINIVKIPLVILPGRVVIQPAATSSAAPFAQPLPYEFLDPLGDLSAYDIILATKINGLDNVWSTSITPPLASLKVTNTIGGEAVSNYDVNFTSGVIQKTKVGETTFVLLRERRVTTSYNLAIDGILQKEGEFQPATVTLSQLSEVSVFASQGKVQFTIMGSLGIPAPAGNITVYKVTGNSFAVVKELIWPGGGSVSTTLPQGTYRATAKVLEIQQSKDFEVKQPITSVDIQMQNLFTRDEFNLVGASLVIMSSEIVFAILVWRRALRSK
ncbi:MAG: hypothetical protein FJ358_06470 [Thaumarchaeota archaeon]|nr:hypothetical protein [Nitrososphaerota archaeon]